MKFEVFDCKPEVEKKPTILKLMPNCSNGGIRLCVVDETGKCEHGGVILTIDTNGELKTYSSLSPKHGIHWRQQLGKARE